MGKTIDEKVVSIEFDNKRFEKNVGQSINTINNLNKSLRLEGATKGLESVQEQSKRMDFSVLNNAVEGVKTKFSALEVVAITALANITNSAVNAGKNLIKSLSTDQIMAGWNKYTQKTSSVQTIMNATGKSIDEVNGYLNKLQWFSDETSYSFTDMSAALATMTSSGGDIEKLIPLIMGVANATAFAGKGAAEFSRVLQYGINQAYSLGYMQVQDWKTIEGATVGSKQLMETLIASAEAMGKIEKGSVTVSNFRSSLADKWLDKEVMEEGFGKFAELTEAAYEAVNSGQYDTAAEAIEALSGSYDDVAVKAFKAAQEAKTFQEAIDATKDAVSSGWAQTAEIIFGNKEEATKLWTSLTNTLWDVFASGAESRNEKLTEILQSGWSAFSKDQVLYQKGFESHLQQVLKDNNIDIDGLIASEGSLEKAIQKGLNDGTISAEHLSLALQKSTSELMNMTDEELKGLGLTREMVEEWKLVDSTVEDFAEKIKKLSGRELLFGGIANIGKSILKIFEAIKEAWRTVFPPATTDQVYNGLSTFHGITEKIFNLVNDNSDKIKNIFTVIFTPIKIAITLIKSVFKLLSPVFNLIKTGLTTVSKVLVDVGSKLGEFVNKTSESTEKLTGGMEKFKMAIESVCTGFVSYIKNIRKAIKESKFLEKLFNVLKKIFDGIKTVISSIGTGIVSFFEHLGNALKNADATTFIALLNTILSGGIIAGIVKLVKSFKGFGDFFGGITDALEGVKDTLKSYQNSLNGQAIKDIGIAIGILAASLVMLSLVDPEGIWNGVAALSTLVLALTLAMIAISKFTKVFEAVGDDGMGTGIKGFLARIGKGLGDGIRSFMSKFGTAQMIVSFGVTLLLLASAMAIMSKMDWKGMGIGLISMTVAMGLFIAAIAVINKISDKKINSAKSNMKALTKISLSILILAVALKMLSSMSWKQMGVGLIALTVMMTALMGVVIGITRLGKIGTKTTTKGISTMLLLAVTILLLTGPLLLLGVVPWQIVLKGLGFVVLTLAALMGVTIGVGRLAKLKGITKGILLILTIAASLLLATGPLVLLGLAPWQVVLKGIGYVILVLAALMGATIGIGQLAKLNGVGKGMAVIILLATSLLIATTPIIALGLMPWEKMKVGLGAMLGVLAILVLVTAIIGNISPAVDGIVKFAGAMALLGLALNLIILPITILGSLPISTIITGIVAMGAALLVLVGIGVLAQSVAIPGLLALAGAVAIIGIGMLLAGAGLSIMAGGLATVLTILAENKELLPLLSTMAGYLLEVGAASVVAGLGFILLGAGLLLMGVASIFLPLLGKALESFAESLKIFVEDLKGSVDGAAIGAAGLLLGLLTILIVCGSLALPLVIGALALTLVALELSLFINNLKPFLEGLKIITGDMVGKAGLLAAILTAMTVTSLVNLLGVITNLGLIVIAMELSSFINHLKPFLEGLKTLPSDILVKVQLLVSVLETICDSSLADLGSIIDSMQLASIAKKLSSFASSATPFFNLLKSIASNSVSKAKTIVNTIKELINLPDGYKKKLNNLGDAVKDLAKDLSKSSGLATAANQIKDLSDNLKEFAGNAITQFTEGTKSLKATIEAEFTDLAQSAADSLSSEAIYNEFYSAGAYVAEGFANGVESKNTSIISKAISMANKAVNAVKNALGINSPSKVFYELGEFTGEGFTNAFDDYNSITYQSGYDMGTNATKGLSKAMARVSSIIESDVDTQPTIRPVLDLSDVTAGAGIINGLFGNQSIGVLSELGPISSSINKIQNRGSNDNVISAIADLKQTLQNASGDNYTINGITYGDGSEIQSAIETLIRAAKIERRR